LLRRVFAIEVLVCPRCAGRRRILGAVAEPHAVRRPLAAIGLAVEPPSHRSVAPSLTAVNSGVQPPAVRSESIHKPIPIDQGRGAVSSREFLDQ
jgi:hypothetical protein